MALWCVMRACVRLKVAKVAVAASGVPTASLTRTDKADACDMAVSTAAEAQDPAQVLEAVVAQVAKAPCASSGAAIASTPKAAATFKAGGNGRSIPTHSPRTPTPPRAGKLCANVLCAAVAAGAGDSFAFF